MEAEEQNDRLSQLPDDILIRILSFLPIKEVARNNLLSKALQKLCYTTSSFLPNLMFKSPDFPHPRRGDTDVSSFINAIDSSLRLRPKHASLAKLRLHLDLKDIESESLIDSWIDAALERKVEELDLYLHPWYYLKSYIKSYVLPAKIFASTTIRVLSLEECELKTCGDIDLPALRKLYLRRMQCSEQNIQKLISSCPLIESLEIAYCHHLRNLHVSGLANLRRLQVTFCSRLKRMEIDAPRLQYLKHYHGICPCDFVLTPSEFLRELALWNLYMTQDFLRNLLSKHPNLERLEIRCTGLQRIEVSHYQLMLLDLTLTMFQKTAKLKIDTPNLQSFKYHGHRRPLTSALSSMNTSSLHELQIDFGDESKDVNFP